MGKISLHKCVLDTDFALAKKLTKDYMLWLGIDLCFQNIDKEFEVFNEMYGAPKGCFIYVLCDGELAGGVGVRLFKDSICEMKRLYVYDKYRGLSIGRKLCEALLEEAKLLGYDFMVLDTVERLKSANALYESIGFKDIPAYYDNPEETVRYMGREL